MQGMTPGSDALCYTTMPFHAKGVEKSVEKQINGWFSLALAFVCLFFFFVFLPKKAFEFGANCKG